MNTNLFLILWLSESRDAKIYSVANPWEGPGGAAPLIFRQNWGLKGRKNFLEAAPPFSKGVNDCHPPLVSQGLDLALLN